MSNLRNCSAFIRKQSVSNILSTMGVAIETNSGPNLSVRTFSQTKQLAKSKNFYEDLEIPRTATQSEIKSAYYELSKAYHPDRNKSEQAKTKFRLISEAYEVLGNVRTRRMYDKGIGTFGGYSSTETDTSSTVNDSEILYEETEDDAVTKFYKQHMVRASAPGRAFAHKVDTYMAQATTNSFHARQQRKKDIRDKQEDIRLHEESDNAYLVLMTIVLAVAIYVSIQQIIHTRDHNAELQRIKMENEKKLLEKKS